MLIPVALMLLLCDCADAAAAVLVGACSNIGAPVVVLVSLPLNQCGSVVAVCCRCSSLLPLQQCWCLGEGGMKGRLVRAEDES